jgi:hypothetical protein
VRLTGTENRHHIPDEIARLMNQSADISEGRNEHIAVPSQAPSQQSTRATKHPSNSRLHELESRWLSLRIDPEFYRVHHFSDPTFSGRRETLSGYIGWCDAREIRSENAQTLKRALDAARRVEGGQPLDAALKDAWAAFPVVTRR